MAWLSKRTPRVVVIDDTTGEQFGTVTEPFVVTGSGSGAANATTAAITRVGVTNATGPALAANAARKGVLVQNEGTATVYLAYAAASAINAYTVQLPPGSYWEMPSPVYTGLLSVVTAAGTANIQVTETI